MELLALYREGIKIKLHKEGKFDGNIFDSDEKMDDEHFLQLATMVFKELSYKRMYISGFTKLQAEWAAEQSNNWHEFVHLLNNSDPDVSDESIKYFL
jgi:hypothetical protein